MTIKEQIELAGIKAARAAKEESMQAKYAAAVAQLPPPLYHTIGGPQDQDEAKEAARALADYLDEIHRETSTAPFFQRLRRAGLIAGDKWAGTLRQAGVAAYLFADLYGGKGKPGSNGKEYDGYYQYQTQFARFAINKKTLERYVNLFRNYLQGGVNGTKKYGPFENEVEKVLEALK